MRQGDRAATLYVIVSGRVRVERGHPALAEPVVLAELGPGQVAGETGVLDGEPRPVTVVALERTEALEIDVATLSQTLVRYPQVAGAVLSTLSRRLRSADELAVEVARQQAPEPSEKEVIEEGTI